MKIKLSQGKYAIIDRCDYKLMDNFKKGTQELIEPENRDKQEHLAFV